MKHMTPAFFTEKDTAFHEKCFGCDRAIKKDEKPCPYQYPYRQWTRIEGCAARTHNKVEAIEDQKMLNPIKASKRKIKQK